MSQPILMGLLVDYFSVESTYETWLAYLYATLLSLNMLTVSAFHGPYYWGMTRLGMNVRCALCTLTYGKVSLRFCLRAAFSIIQVEYVLCGTLWERLQAWLPVQYRREKMTNPIVLLLSFKYEDGWARIIVIVCNLLVQFIAFHLNSSEKLFPVLYISILYGLLAY